MSKGLALALGGAALAIGHRLTILWAFPQGGQDFIVHAGAMLIMGILAFLGVWNAPNGKPLDYFKAAAQLTSIFALVYTGYVILEHTVINPEALVEKKRVALDYMERIDFDSLKTANPEQFANATREQWASGHVAWVERTSSPKLISLVTFFGYLVLGLVYSAFSAVFGPKIKG